MDQPQRIWLAGLRRAWIASGALLRWAAAKGVTGVVWTPASYDTGDIGPTLVKLIAAGARPDASLLWDLASADIRAACESVAGAYRDSDGRSGYVAVWIDPARLGDPAKAARELVGDVRRANVAVGLAWSPQRASVVEQIVGAGVPVALSGVRELRDREAVAQARSKGMETLRREAANLERPPESVPRVPVFLLGATGPDDDEGIFPVALDTELGLFSKVVTGAAGLPSSAEAEQAGLRSAVEALARRAALPAYDDSYAPESFRLVVARESRELATDDVLSDIWERDHTAWKEDAAEITDRLGWLDVPELMASELPDIQEFARKARAGGDVQHVVLCGMGGSSLAPQTFRSALGGGVPLTVCDTTDPDYIASLTSSLDFDHTMFVVASKSGTTVETRAHLEHFWARCRRPDRFVAITDPGTPLAALARERGFQRVFENPPDIGGRFSALSYFGLVPAAIAGVDIAALVDGGRRGMARNAAGVAPPDAPGVRLGAAIAETKLTQRRDKLTFVLPGPLAALGAWCEQLVAESTGKEGTGIVPVVGEDLGSPEVYGDDRLFCVYSISGEPRPAHLEAIETDHPVVCITVPDAKALGAEVYRWEMAIAIVGYLLDINPFDQPDVEAAKRRTQEVLSGSATRPDPGSAADLLTGLEPPRYVALQAFLEPSDENAKRLEAVRARLREKYRVAVTVGFGPRFLHSTGQLHKGGPDTGVFLQITGRHTTDVPIPGMDFTFGRLIDAQADGDLQALRDAGRGAARLTLDELEKLSPG